MNILITGASGYIGGRLIEILSSDSNNHFLTLAVRSKASKSIRNFSNTRLKNINLESLTELEDLCKNIDVVVHLAGVKAQDCKINPAYAISVNSLGTSNLLQAAINQKVKRFICMSSIHVYGELLNGKVTEETSTNPINPYASSHKAAEDMVRYAHHEKQIEGVVIRLSNAIGPPIDSSVPCWSLLVNELCTQAITSNVMVLKTAGIQSRDFITMTDTCKIIEHLIELPSAMLGDGLFNAGSGRSRSILGMAKIIRDRIFLSTQKNTKIYCKISDLHKSDVYMKYSIDKLIKSGFELESKANFNQEIDSLVKFILKSKIKADSIANQIKSERDFSKKYLEFRESNMFVERHDLQDGFQSECQICGNKELELVIDLGSQPLGDKLESINSKKEDEIAIASYPLAQVYCNNCSLNQLNYICPSHILFGDDYSYKTGVTNELVEYQAGMAKELVNELNLTQKDLVCDLGSNDGTLLKGFLKQNVKVIGVEPTDIADLANDDGINTLRMPFGEYAANGVVSKVGKVSLATATNVFAHVQKLGDFIRGLDILLKDDGWFCFENHYLFEIIDKLQYDTIYHEHLRSLSVSAVVNLFSQYKFTVMKVEKTTRYGGNMRVMVQKGKHERVNNSVEEFIKLEREMGLFTYAKYQQFRDGVIATKIDLLNFLLKIKKENKKIAGYSLPARAITLINYVGIDNDLLPYVVEQRSSLKLNRFIPGTKIPVISNECLEENKPDYLLVFAWHLKDEIIYHLRERGIKGICIFPLPEVNLVEL
jgi:nucleoside-diphosphate-sugar epimerase